MKHPKHVFEVASALSCEYGNYDHRNKNNPLDELIFIICSIRTEEHLYTPVYHEIKKHYPSAMKLFLCSEKDLEHILRPAGLSNIKARYIKKSLRMIVKKFGKPTLAPLRKMSDKQCEKFLTSLPNVGKKVARCIMMYSLDRTVFPVDVHCWRISRRLGWVRKTQKDDRPSPRDMDRLQSKIPMDVRYSLHVNMISLGRSICLKNKPKCSICNINKYCRKIGVRLAV